ncbi:ATP-grasp domain-containing protein [Streptomyces sp. NPDC002888]|uniref:carboxylate--amine ligase n=1 Tax=Streptomyces sp. NPDC002888 TaxID=3364668 RepID=UPI0036C1404F
MDHDVPALLVKAVHCPQQHGGLGALRTLGRAGVPVHAMVEDQFTPTAVSRHLAGRFTLPTTGLADPRLFVPTLLGFGRAIGRRTVAVAADDEAAVLLAEYSERLAKWFLLPEVPPTLPRRLASKEGLGRICAEHGVPTPRSRAPADRVALVGLGRDWGYPLVLKNREAFTRLRAPIVSHTTVVHDEGELLDLLGSCREPAVLAQEYIPDDVAEDWITHLYCGAGGVAHAVFTGYKVRSWPPYSGATTRAWSRPNPELARLAGELCRRIGYSGVADLGWRFDRRDGRYKLVDFNPRIGAQFRLFETWHGVDVVRAMYLDLTGQPIPGAPQRYGRMFVVGQLDVLSAAASARRERRMPQALLPRRGTERAWLSRDDPIPAVAEAVRFGGTVTRRFARATADSWRSRARRRNVLSTGARRW